MSDSNSASSRREFLTRVGAISVLGKTVTEASAEPLDKQNAAPTEAVHKLEVPVRDLTSSIDFRYAPVRQQLTMCFPDDPHKSLIGESGELRLGHGGWGHGNLNDFALVAEFSLLGMEPDVIRSQRLEGPNVPVVHTRLDRPDAYLEMTTFSSREPGEGRVDNIILEVRPKEAEQIDAVPLVNLRSRKSVKRDGSGTPGSVISDRSDTPVFIADCAIVEGLSATGGYSFLLEHGVATDQEPLQYFLRFPLEGQSPETLSEGLRDPERILENVRLFWKEWKPFGGNVDWQLPSRYGEFLAGCTRNILEAREVKNGKLTFQVGPTVYRGLWIVDGNFILEAARYLGYDKEAQQGLETTWAQQEAGGGIFAAGGREHWKDTGIALFTLTRQAELSQDYTYFRQMQGNALRAVNFLRKLRVESMKQDTPNGRYGILPNGFADGGVDGLRSEFTNTVWVLAGLKAWLDKAQELNLSGIMDARNFYRELSEAFLQAARQEMQTYPQGGFQYLPMVAKDDPIWKRPDPWERPRPQTAQWALSHAIFPGRVFDLKDPVVQGHIRLMQAVTHEDVPIDTGWLHHGGVWTYNAPFVSEVYLWAGLPEWARSTFHGFLNHATPNYCWREEQPVKGSLTAGYVGDMPHNWASAECIRYLRHMLVLEDGPSLRLLAGVGEPELANGEPALLRDTPTRFGRIDFDFEPVGRNAGWRLKFKRAEGPAPSAVLLPSKLGRQFSLASLIGAGKSSAQRAVAVDPAATAWEAIWKP
jgi:hypothetical protein